MHFLALEGRGNRGDENNTHRGASRSALVTKHYSGDQIKKHEIGGSCSEYGGEVHTDSWWGNLKEREHVEDLRVEWRIILKWKLDGT